MTKRNFKIKQVPLGGKTTKGKDSRTAGGRGTARKQTTSRATSRGTDGRGSGRHAPSKESARPSATQSRLNMLQVRIGAVALASAALTGGVLLSIYRAGTADAGLIVGLIALGTAAGLGIYTAIKPKEVMSWLGRRRR